MTLAGDGVILNDAHSALNPTTVARVVRPDTVGDIVAAVHAAAAEGRGASIAGSRHAMGGQQFGADTVHLDMRGMNRIVALDAETGIVDAESGIEWAELIDGLLALQADHVNEPGAWGIRQKQTGADQLTLGGALAADVHGRGLTQRPISADVESFTLVDPLGEVREVSRTSNPELFGLVIGGYGLFGVVTSVRLRLAPRQILRRVVTLTTVDELIQRFGERIADGFLFGDCQFSIDERSPDFLRVGIFSCYGPDETATAIPEG